MKYYYKRSDGKVFELDQQYYLWLYSMDIIELIIPDGCKKVNCQCNQLKKLVLPNVCEYVSCWCNQLKELIIPDGCVTVSCENNQLNELILPDGCEKVWADMKSVTVLNKVEELNLYI